MSWYRCRLPGSPSSPRFPLGPLAFWHRVQTQNQGIWCSGTPDWRSIWQWASRSLTAAGSKVRTWDWVPFVNMTTGRNITASRAWRRKVTMVCREKGDAADVSLCRALKLCFLEGREHFIGELKDGQPATEVRSFHELWLTHRWGLVHLPRK